MEKLPSHTPSGMTSSSTQDSTLSLPKMSSTHAHRAGKEAKRCADLFETSTALDKRMDVASVEWNDVNVGPLLGEGSFASVFQVSLVSDSSKQPKLYALKCLKKSVVENEKKRVLVHGTTDLALEAKMLQHLSHENIIRLHAVKAGCILTATCEPGGFFLLLDHLECTLADMILTWKHESKQRRSKRRLFSFTRVQPEQHMALWNRLQSSALGIARGLEYLHKNNIHHGDVKPRNVGFSCGTIKLFDFGLARENHEARVLPERCASTPRYAAPEVLPNDQQGDCSADVYSFGIVLWEIASLKRPFGDIRQIDDFEREIIQGNLRPPRKYIPTKALKSITSRAWDRSPEKRPTMSQVRQVLEDEITAVLGCEDYTHESIESTCTTDCSVLSQDEDCGDEIVVAEYDC